MNIPTPIIPHKFSVEPTKSKTVLRKRKRKPNIILQFEVIKN